MKYAVKYIQKALLFIFLLKISCFKYYNYSFEKVIKTTRV